MQLFGNLAIQVMTYVCHPHVYCDTSMYCFHNRICFERKQRLYPGDMYLVMDAPCYYMYCVGLDSYTEQ